jgi:hypothetical protein
VNQPSKKSTHIRRILILMALLAVMWLPTLGFGYYAIRPLVSIAVPIGLLFTIVCAVRWRSVRALSVLLFSPVTVLFAFGISDWFSRRPQFHGMGLPGMEFSNLDSKTRCYHATGGCVVTGGEWLFEIPHNVGLEMMCAVFGPPTKTYHGAYPTIEQALVLTTNAPPTPIRRFLDGQVVTRSKSVELGKKTIEDLLFDFGNVYAGTELDGVATEVKAAVFQEQCLVVRVRTTDRDGGPDGESDGVYLFDITEVRPFARFVLKGHAWRRIPRLLTRID